MLVVIFTFLALVSYWGASYEYKNVQKQYEKLHDDVAKKVGHHIEQPVNGSSSKMANDHKNKGPVEIMGKKFSKSDNSTDDDVESLEDFQKEESQMFEETFFFPLFGFGMEEEGNSTHKFNFTHFME